MSFSVREKQNVKATDPFWTHSSPALHGPQSGFSPTQILRYKIAAHWWYSSRVGLHIGRWELIVGSNTQHASLQSVSFSQNVPGIDRMFAGFSDQLFDIYSYGILDCM